MINLNNKRQDQRSSMMTTTIKVDRDQQNLNNGLKYQDFCTKASGLSKFIGVRNSIKKLIELTTSDIMVKKNFIKGMKATRETKLNILNSSLDTEISSDKSSILLTLTTSILYTKNKVSTTLQAVCFSNSLLELI